MGKCSLANTVKQRKSKLTLLIQNTGIVKMSGKGVV